MVVVSCARSHPIPLPELTDAVNVVALVSGGKDSVFCMMEAVRLGHHIVALANLHPAGGADEQELDSFMFQTVGHNVVEGIAACMGLPLYRYRTVGRAKQTSVAYVTPQPHMRERTEVGCGASDADASGETVFEDEVEDLYHLLAAVKARQPEVSAVCSGAILSNYQRCRVENVYVCAADCGQLDDRR